MLQHVSINNLPIEACINDYNALTAAMGRIVNIETWRILTETRTSFYIQAARKYGEAFTHKIID